MKNLRQTKKDTPIEEKVFELPEYIICGDVKYKFTDINTNWLFIQQKIATKEFSKMYVNKGGEMSADMSVIFDYEFEATILALIYIEENENCFNISTFNKRKANIINNLVYDEKLGCVKDYFFTNKINSIIKDFQSFSNIH